MMLKLGQRFEHPRFLDPSDNGPLVVEITSIRGAWVFWRATYRDARPLVRSERGGRWRTLRAIVEQTWKGVENA